MTRPSFRSAALLAALLSTAALAGEAEVEHTYEISTAGSTTQVKAGGSGTLVIEIKTTKEAHISDEAPLKIELSGSNVTPSKSKLVYADSVTKKPSEAGVYPQPRFEVPFTAAAAGAGKVDAKMVFFVCTENVCARQQKTVSVPIQVQ